MFVSEEARVPLPFAAASARLANLAGGGALLAASQHAYGEAVADALRVGPAPSLSRLVKAEFCELIIRGDSAVLTLRWEAAGATGARFPALDADITIVRAGDDATLLRLDGVYRAPLGGVGAGLDSLILHRVASATIRGFVARVAVLIVHPSPQTAPDGARSEWSPQPGTA